jgi:hypothetical protein
LLSIRNSLGRACAVGILAVTAAAGFVGPASASVAPFTAHMAHVTHVAVAPSVTGPNTTIKGTPAAWHPTSLTGPPVTGTCSGTNFTFSITNAKAVAEKISVKPAGGTKMPLGTIPAHTKVAICGSGPKGAKAKFFIKGSTSVLTVTLS